ncbi:MAG: Uma2 family endonuclease [Blastocatellia bacterium]|nr:Uma2 family endonuclease [Blastocatellia bacterium]
MTTVFDAIEDKSLTVLAGEGGVVLHNISWGTYLSLLEDLDEKTSVHLNYDRGTLEIMTLSPRHERYSRIFTVLLENLSSLFEIDIEETGSTTFKREDLQGGFEADTSFYFKNAVIIREKLKKASQSKKKKDRRVEIDLATDPAPELVIEVDISNSSLNKMPIYARVAVQEIWRYDGYSVYFYQLDVEAGEYKLINRSLSFPSVTPELVRSYLEKSIELSRPELARYLRELLRPA